VGLAACLSVCKVSAAVSWLTISSTPVARKKLQLISLRLLLTAYLSSLLIALLHHKARLARRCSPSSPCFLLWRSHLLHRRLFLFEPLP
jgi:hypothetical protein